MVNNMLSIVIDPGRLVDLDWLGREVDAMVGYAKGSPPADPAAPVLVAGDPERAAARLRSTEGVPVDDTTWEELLQAGETVGLARAEAERLSLEVVA
jgi:uncharacterized oxidoreductase